MALIHVRELMRRLLPAPKQTICSHQIWTSISAHPTPDTKTNIKSFAPAASDHPPKMTASVACRYDASEEPLTVSPSRDRPLLESGKRIDGKVRKERRAENRGEGDGLFQPAPPSQTFAPTRSWPLLDFSPARPAIDRLLRSLDFFLFFF